MNYEEILETMLRIAFMLKDDDRSLSFEQMLARAHDNGQMLSIADEDISIHEIIRSDDFGKYFTIDTAAGTTDGGLPQRVILTDEGMRCAIELNTARYANPQSLFNWAFIGNFDERLRVLADMAQPESWSEGDKPYGVLATYISNTFKRLLHERKSENPYAIIETEKWAAFNTGLVDRLYDPIFALFALNKKPHMQKWSFQSWCTPGNRRAGQILSRFFETLPHRASYFTDPTELLYNENAGVPTLPFDHILERIERLPLHFLKKNAPDGFVWPADDITPDKDFYQRLRDALEADDFARLRIKDALELSLRRAVKKVAWNYRMAIPVYDAKRRKLMLLIPMSLDFRDNNSTDIVLMVERAKISRKYVGHTILTPAMAYRKARMIMRPEADWLTHALLENHDTAQATDEEQELLALEISAADADAKVNAEVKEREEEMVLQNTQVANSQTDAEELTKTFQTQHEHDDIFRPEEINRPKVVDKIDLSGFKQKNIFHKLQQDETASGSAPQSHSVDAEQYMLPADRDFDIRGIYHDGGRYGRSYILVGRYRFEAREFTDSGILDEEDVIFDIEEEENKWNKNGRFKYAVNIRLADD